MVIVRVEADDSLLVMSNSFEPCEVDSHEVLNILLDYEQAVDKFVHAGMISESSGPAFEPATDLLGCEVLKRHGVVFVAALV